MYTKIGICPYTNCIFEVSGGAHSIFCNCRAPFSSTNCNAQFLFSRKIVEDLPSNPPVVWTRSSSKKGDSCIRKTEQSLLVEERKLPHRIRDAYFPSHRIMPGPNYFEIFVLIAKKVYISKHRVIRNCFGANSVYALSRSFFPLEIRSFEQ